MSKSLTLLVDDIAHSSSQLNVKIAVSQDIVIDEDFSFLRVWYMFPSMESKRLCVTFFF